MSPSVFPFRAQRSEVNAGNGHLISESLVSFSPESEALVESGIAMSNNALLSLYTVAPLALNSMYPLPSGCDWLSQQQHCILLRTGQST